MGKFVMKQTKSGGVKFDLKATNGQVIASSQTYKSARTAKIGIASVAANAPKAALEDQTAEGYEKQKHPKFEVYQDKAGEYRVSEGYVTMANCLNGVESVRKNAVDAPVEMEQ